MSTIAGVNSPGAGAYTALYLSGDVSDQVGIFRSSDANINGTAIDDAGREFGSINP